MAWGQLSRRIRQNVPQSFVQTLPEAVACSQLNIFLQHSSFPDVAKHYYPKEMVLEWMQRLSWKFLGDWIPKSHLGWCAMPGGVENACAVRGLPLRASTDQQLIAKTSL
jgi:hypothetical protein